MILVAAILGGILLLVALNYAFALDWGRQHTQSVALLDVYSADATEGIFRIPANGLEFRVRIAGSPQAKRRMVLLHGFPESSAKWSPLMSKLTEAGFRVAAFDQRGYSPGARPDAISSYENQHLVSDVFAVADALGFGQFHLLGHDWGAVVGWLSVLQQPERIHSWTAMAIPHPQAFFGGIANGGQQAERSGYFDFFRLPIIPEVAAQYRLKTSLGHLPEDRQTEYRALLSEPGAFTAALNWYRAMDIERLLSRIQAYPKIEVPTLFIGGIKDSVVAPDAISAQRQYMAGPFQSRMFDTGHGIIEEEFEQVTELIMEHIQR